VDAVRMECAAATAEGPIQIGKKHCTCHPEIQQ
jgi:hypothetical protein